MIICDVATVETTDAPARFAEPALRSSKVAIVGFGSETLGEAPFDDPDCEIWILNMLHGVVPRWDRLFELHDRATVEQDFAGTAAAQRVRWLTPGEATTIEV